MVCIAISNIAINGLFERADGNVPMNLFLQDVKLTKTGKYGVRGHGPNLDPWRYVSSGNWTFLRLIRNSTDLKVCTGPFSGDISY